MKLQLEEWRSDHNRCERHFFRYDGKSHGYQNAQYVFGVNPEIVNEETVSQIIALISKQVR